MPRGGTVVNRGPSTGMGRGLSDRARGLPIKGELRVHKAKARAAARGPAIFTGEAALESVAQHDGNWNWCLVGPDPEELPLSAGGTGGVQEMQAAIGLVKHSFGLLRMHFLTEGGLQTWHLFVHATDDDNSEPVSVKDRMQAMKKPEMEKAIRGFCPFSASIALHSKEDCTEEFVVLKLREIIPQEALEFVTEENLHAATAAWKEEHKEEEQQKVEEQDDMEIVAPHAQKRVAETPALAQEVEATHDEEHDHAPAEAARNRKSFRPPQVGEPVEVYSTTLGKWVTDGEVVAITMQSLEENGERVPAGSTKVVFGNGRRYKWVPGHQLEQTVRKSARPRAPQPVRGVQFLKVYSWFIPDWEQRYFELNKGFLQWWPRVEDAQAGAVPEATVYLLGLQQEQVHSQIKFRTDSTTRAIYTIRFQAKEDQQAWTEALWLHAEYCEGECEYFKSLDRVPIGEAQARERADKQATAAHLRRPSLASLGPGFVTSSDSGAKVES